MHAANEGGGAINAFSEYTRICPTCMLCMASPTHHIRPYTSHTKAQNLYKKRTESGMLQDGIRARINLARERERERGGRGEDRASKREGETERKGGGGLTHSHTHTLTHSQTHTLTHSHTHTPGRNRTSSWGRMFLRKTLGCQLMTEINLWRKQLMAEINLWRKYLTVSLWRKSTFDRQPLTKNNIRLACIPQTKSVQRVRPE